MVQAELEKVVKIGHGNSVFDMRPFDLCLANSPRWIPYYRNMLINATIL